VSYGLFLVMNSQYETSVLCGLLGFLENLPIIFMQRYALDLKAPGAGMSGETDI